MLAEFQNTPVGQGLRDVVEQRERRNQMRPQSLKKRCKGMPLKIHLILKYPRGVRVVATPSHHLLTEIKREGGGDSGVEIPRFLYPTLLHPALSSRSPIPLPPPCPLPLNKYILFFVLEKLIDERVSIRFQPQFPGPNEGVIFFANLNYSNVSIILFFNL